MRLKLLDVVCFGGAGVLWLTSLFVGLPLGQSSSAGGPVRVAAAGDLVCQSAQPRTNIECRDRQTAKQAQAFHPDAVLLLGDIEYDVGSLAEFRRAFAASWGEFGALIHPVTGNHEYYTPTAQGYFDYFNGPGVAFGQAGWRDRGYYSFDAGNWHILALNSDCEYIGNCGPGSPEYHWVERDLAAHPGQCVLAYWHHPVQTSGQFRNTTSDTNRMKAMWGLLVRAQADLVLNGHDHIYEQFGPLDADGHPSAQGLRQITVGSGGKSHSPLTGPPLPGSVRLDATDYGSLELRLAATSYDWRFVTETGRIADAGSANCHLAAIAP